MSQTSNSKREKIIKGVQLLKKKKLKLVRTKTYSPIVAVMGGKHHTDYMPINYSQTIPVDKKTTKVNTKTMTKSRIRKIFTHSEE
jgi:hypothetical protein